MSSRQAKSVAIVQSNYIPWKGYFDMIDSVDEFILFDDRQYTRRDWRNRNRIKTPEGTKWLSIPVKVKGKYLQRIDETEVSDPSWAGRHWHTLVRAYRNAPFFEEYEGRLHDLYARCGDIAMLSQVNRLFLDAICEMLGILTPLVWSTEYCAEGTKSERLVSLCRSAAATTYRSGPTARAYLDEALFAGAEIELKYMDYSRYPTYDQLYPPFEHAVSVLDVLVHVGPEALEHVSSTRRRPGSRDAA